MVITHILGGIGNQMFQYAAGRALSLQHGVNLACDLRDFRNYSFGREFELKRVFSLEVHEASSGDLSRILGWRSNSNIIRALKQDRLRKFRGTSFVLEPYFHYWSEFRQIPSSVYIYGYWQSEKYFKEFEKTIRQDFSFGGLLDDKNLAIKEDISNHSSISLHVRRGDYVTDLKTSKIMSICDAHYYEKAIEYICGLVSDPIFYVFSDDIQWAKENIHIPCRAIYVGGNVGQSSYKDMQLMSNCKHQIIANSSFSWWGAWLNSNSEKIVIAPKKWFLNGNCNGDLLPEGWVRI